MMEGYSGGIEKPKYIRPVNEDDPVSPCIACGLLGSWIEVSRLKDETAYYCDEHIQHRMDDPSAEIMRG